MNKHDWTPPQKDAIDARAGSVLVSAAAGSGKTAVLVQRIIEALTDPVNPIDIDRMLIVTFTRAASAEMRERIERALGKLLLKNPHDKHILKQRQLLYSARISTIDGFCTDFVRRYFYKLGIQNDFRIADEGELALMQNQALDNTMEFFYQNSDRAFLDLVDAVCTYRDDSNLREYIRKTYGFFTSVPFAEQRLDEMCALYAPETDFADTVYAKYILDYAAECALFCSDLISTSLSMLETETSMNDKQLKSLRDMLLDDFAQLQKVNEKASLRDWDGLKEAVENTAFKRFPSIRGVDDPVKDEIKSARTIYKDELEALEECFLGTLEECNERTAALYPMMSAFVACVKRFSQEFSALKNEKNVLDFADIERLMIELLCEYKDGEVCFTDISEEISSTFDAIMVDEFQDVNEVQDLLFRAVSGGRNNLFVVGDVKQSIYGFRQAKPDIFINYKNRYPIFNRENPAYPSKIILDKNFRSRKGILEACNFVFKNLMSKEVGGLEYGEEEILNYGATYYPESDDVNMELMLVDTSELDAENDETTVSAEAQCVADKINRLVREEKPNVFVGGETRKLRFGDIAILIRNPASSRRAVTFVEVLQQNLIPAVSKEKSAFFESTEIKIMLNMLRVIDNPVQDIPILSVMLSPLFGFNADDVAELRAGNRKQPFYVSVTEKAKRDEKCAAFAEFIASMRTLAVTVTVDKLIDTILSRTGYDNVVMALRGGEADNLNLLKQYARDFAAKGYKTLTSFISYIDRLKNSGSSLDAGALSEENLDAVSVISIHASKGLEYPVCFISCTGSKFNMSDINESLVLNADCGFGFRVKEDYLVFDTVQRKALSLMMKDAMISEELRILYVAMTRAKERLIITAAHKKPEEYLQSLRSLCSSGSLSPYVVRGMNCYADWLFSCALMFPNCEGLDGIELCESESGLKPWSFTMCSSDDFESESDFAETEKVSPQKVEPDRAFLEEFKRRIGFRYRNAPLTGLPQKVSASALAHSDSGIFDAVLSRPEFAKEKTAEGTERGTAFHNFMQRCDLKKAREDSRGEAKRLCKAGHLTERQCELLSYDDLDAFLHGKLIDRVLASDEYYREYTFTVKLNASDVQPEISPEFSDSKVVLQGAVDLVFVEDGSLVIVDYKTDRVREAEKLKELYSKQLELYKNAMEEIFETKVKEMVIYSVHLNKEVLL